MTVSVNFGGNTIVCDALRVGATNPGDAGTDITTSTALLNATAGVVTASKAVIVDANKDISRFRALDAITFNAGTSGTAGFVNIYAATVAQGRIALQCADNSGNFVVTITNASHDASRTYTIPNAGAAANFVMTQGANVLAGTWTQGSDATDRVVIKGHYMSPSNVAVTVPAITDPDIAKVDVSVAAAFSMQPAVGDLVYAIPQEAMEANARILGAYVTATDQVTVIFGSEGGNVTGGSKNFKFLVVDLT